MVPDPIEDVRERLIRKIGKMRERSDLEKLAAGWTKDESYDLMIPPGYVRGPENRPKEVEQRMEPDDGI